MQCIQPKQSAPMPKKEEDIVKNSMKLYSYFITISGLATYPSNTRMFRQKNIVLSKIKEVTGITEKTVKLYLYYLEEHGLIEYKGEKPNTSFKFIDKLDFDKNGETYSPAAYRKKAQEEAVRVWNNRQKDKQAVYHIPRPTPWTPVPEVTLQKLNEVFKATELELKIYLFMCMYRDTCVKQGWNYKAITYENLRDIMGLSKNHSNDRAIFTSLTFLEKLGLISFKMGYTNNSKNAPIPLFKITEVGYYINQYIKFEDSELISELEQKELKEVYDRIENGFKREKSLK